MLIEDVITDYFDNLLRLSESEIIGELSQYGWKRSKILRKKFTNTTSIDSKEIIRDFNLPSETVNQSSPDG